MKDVKWVIENVINQGKHACYDGEDIKGGFHSALEAELRRQGWTYHETGSYCTKASGETHLQKDGLAVEIISASFLGSFTQIHTVRI
jgi:hypothetical protein